jgi:hypothetical protein
MPAYAAAARLARWARLYAIAHTARAVDPRAYLKAGHKSTWGCVRYPPPARQRRSKIYFVMGVDRACNPCGSGAYCAYGQSRPTRSKL